MHVNPIFLIELFLFNGAALAWAGYEFWSVRPGKDKDKDTSAPGDEAGHPEG